MDQIASMSDSAVSAHSPQLVDTVDYVTNEVRRLLKPERRQLTRQQVPKLLALSPEVVLKIVEMVDEPHVYEDSDAEHARRRPRCAC